MTKEIRDAAVENSADGKWRAKANRISTAAEIIIGETGMTAEVIFL